MRVWKDIAATRHALERIQQRMVIGKQSPESVIKSAWLSKEKLSEAFLRSKYNLNNYGFASYYYRKYKGYLFCFQKKYIDIVLITVFYEDSEELKKHEAHYKNTTRKHARRSFLQDLYSEKNGTMRRKNNPRARHNLRRETGRREMGNNPSV